MFTIGPQDVRLARLGDLEPGSLFQHPRDSRTLGIVCGQVGDRRALWLSGDFPLTCSSIADYHDQTVVHHVDARLRARCYENPRLRGEIANGRDASGLLGVTFAGLMIVAKKYDVEGRPAAGYTTWAVSLHSFSVLIAAPDPTTHYVSHWELVVTYGGSSESTSVAIAGYNAADLFGAD